MQNAPPSPTSPTSPVPPQNKRTRFTSALSALAHLATAAREPPPPRPPPDEAELRRLWRPVAAWRVAARRAGADDAAAADAALAMWAALAGRSFLGKVKAAPAPRGLALGLARALAGLPIAPRDDAAALAAAVHAAVTDVVAARADEVDAAAALAAAAATVDELTRAVRLARDAFGQPPDAATTDFWRPPPAPPSPVRDLLNQPRPLSNDSGLAEAHAAHVARAHLPRLCAWRGALTAGDDVDAQLRRCYFGGAVAPDGGGWTYDEAAARGVARGCPAGLAGKLETPRALVLAALRWARVVFGDHARAVGAVAGAARAASARRAAWLPPVDLRLTDAAALRCQCSAAVDPAGAALSLVVTATIVAVADDSSGPPPRRRGRAAGLPAVPPPAGEVPTRPPSPGVDAMRSTLP